MLSQRLDTLIRELGTNNSEVAACAGFDRTNISRFRSGSRLPKASSSSARRLAEGLYRYASEHDGLNTLYTITGIEPGNSDDEIKLALISWLYEGEDMQGGCPQCKSSSSTEHEEAADDTFAARLSFVMKLADISNVSLSRRMNVDASLISRYRTGQSVPAADSDIAMELSDILYKRIHKNGRVNELVFYMNISEGSFDEKAFNEWFYKPDNASAMRKPKGRTRGRSAYVGIGGLREAVVRFLKAVLKNGDSELMLYSDQDMGWMTEDMAFFDSWRSLMEECISQKIRIRIIHNIDRKQDEIDMAIKSWLPLYMSGGIEPYISSVARGDRFFHTIFICPGLAAIEASGPAGSEDSAIYNYHTGEEYIEAAIADFERLMENSKPVQLSELKELTGRLNL